MPDTTMDKYFWKTYQDASSARIKWWFFLKRGECVESPKFRIPGIDTEFRFFWENKLNAHKRKSPQHLFLFCADSDVDMAMGCDIHINFQSAPDYEFKRSLHVDKIKRRHFIYTLVREDLILSEITLTAKLSTNVTNVHSGEGSSSNGQPKRKRTLSADWTQFLEKNQDTDVVLKSAGQDILAHKAVLICRSPVFATMFRQDMAEMSSNEVLIDDIECEVMQELVRFMYTDSFSAKSVEFALKLAIAADKYDLPSLISSCSDYLSLSVSYDNVYEILTVANALRLSELCEQCLSVIDRRVPPVSCLADCLKELKNFPELVKEIKHGLIENLKF